MSNHKSDQKVKTGVALVALFSFLSFPFPSLSLSFPPVSFSLYIQPSILRKTAPPSSTLLIQQHIRHGHVDQRRDDRNRALRIAHVHANGVTPRVLINALNDNVECVDNRRDQGRDHQEGLRQTVDLLVVRPEQSGSPSMPSIQCFWMLSFTLKSGPRPCTVAVTRSEALALKGLGVSGHRSALSRTPARCGAEASRDRAGRRGACRHRTRLHAGSVAHTARFALALSAADPVPVVDP